MENREKASRVAAVKIDEVKSNEWGGGEVGRSGEGGGGAGRGRRWGGGRGRSDIGLRLCGVASRYKYWWSNLCGGGGEGEGEG